MTNENELTPAERAAVAARGWYDRTFQRGEPLRDHASKMLYSQLGAIYGDGPERCPTCNAGGHRCGGCGHPVPHGDGPVDYSDHGPGCPGFEAWHLERSLADYALGVVSEWMRIIELERLPGQQRVTWQDAAGTFILGERPLGEEYGRFRLKITVETLPPPPPIGPENDPAQIEERRAGFCMECMQPDEDPITWCDCRSDEPPCRVPCKQNAHDPKDCPNHSSSDECSNCAPLRANASIDRVDGSDLTTRCVDCGAVETEVPEWVPRTWADVRKGDRVRLPGTEHVAEVSAAIHLPWHVHPASDRYNVIPAQWSSVTVTLAGRQYQKDPAKPIEIELSPSEVAAIELLGGWSNREGIITAPYRPGGES